MRKWLFAIAALPIALGFTYGYKPNMSTGKPDLVMTGLTTADITGFSNSTSARNYVSLVHFNAYSAARSAERATLGTAAYQPSSAFDPAGAAAAVKDTTTKTGILKGNGLVISPAANSDLPAMSATVGGAVPTPPNDATKFLNGAAGFTVPNHANLSNLDFSVAGHTGTLPIANGGTGNTSGTATINANLTGPITSSGNATAVAAQTGTGSKFVMDTSPTLVTPNIGAATATSINGAVIDNTAWTAYTPTYVSDIGNQATTFSGGTVTTNLARYKVIGKTLFLQINFSGTLNLVTPVNIQVSLPNSYTAQGASMYSPAIVGNSGSDEVGLIRTVSYTLVFYRLNFATFTSAGAVSGKVSTIIEIN